MTNTLVNGITEIAVQAILSILGVVVTYLTTVAVTYLKKKREALIKEIGATQYNTTYNIAKSIYFAVEQQFRFIPEAGKEKKEIFDKMLLEKVPGLNKEDLDHFREAVVGEINNQMQQAKLFEPAPLFNCEIEQADPVVPKTINPTGEITNKID